MVVESDALCTVLLCDGHVVFCPIRQMMLLVVTVLVLTKLLSFVVLVNTIIKAPQTVPLVVCHARNGELCWYEFLHSQP